MGKSKITPQDFGILEAKILQILEIAKIVIVWLWL